MQRGLMKSGMVGLIAITLAFPLAKPAFAGNPVGDFFKRLGNSIAHPQKKTAPHSTKKGTKSVAGKSPAPLVSPSPSDAPPAVQTEAPAAPPPTPPPQTVREANVVPRQTRRDMPYGVPVPGRPGFVTSPYAPTVGLVDVRNFPSGTEVIDPYTGKIFLTP